MRRIILVMILAAFGLVLLPSPADGAIKASPSLALPVSAMAVDQDGWPDTDRTPGWGTGMGLAIRPPQQYPLARPIRTSGRCGPGASNGSSQTDGATTQEVLRRGQTQP